MVHSNSLPGRIHWDWNKFTYILVDFHGKCRKHIPIPWILWVIDPSQVPRWYDQFGNSANVTFGMVSKITK